MMSQKITCATIGNSLAVAKYIQEGNKKMNIIDDVLTLSKLQKDELDETLLSDKYNNSANLRELIKRCIHQIKMGDYYVAELEHKVMNYKYTLDSIKLAINNLD